MKVWITKYALTRGILQADGEADGSMFEVTDSRHPGALKIYYHGDEWHIKRAAAVKRAEEMRRKKIASLRRQITRLEALIFEEEP